MTHTHRNPRARLLGSRPILIATTTGLIGAQSLLAAPEAGAGTFRAVQCSPGAGAGHEDAAFTSNSPRYVQSADCEGPGLGIRHVAGDRATAGGRFGAWTLTAPTGVEIVRAVTKAKGRAESGHKPELAVRLESGESKVISGLGSVLRTLTWAGLRGRSLSARLTCSRSRCGAGDRAYMQLRRLSLTLRDSVLPGVRPGGELLAEGSRRGVQGLTMSAHDSGSGVRSMNVDVNGDPLVSRTIRCSLSGPVAIRLRPCPTDPVRNFDIATRSPLFRQGPNNVRFCAADYGARLNSNRKCETHEVRIDSLCPISGVAGATLRARFVDGGDRVRTTSTEAAIVAGSVLGADGNPLSGARVCVATRAYATNHPERIVATPLTDAQGRFRARIPEGPSREVRVAHWPDAEGALERYLQLTARAVPRLNLSPDRTLRNGESVRFWVRIPGPSRSWRRVVIQARSAHRWVQVTSGRTNRSGIWRGSYRFRSTTGTRRYAFRARVPRQSGYPFEPGHSPVRRARVAG
ncbi:MAG: hypothetical protein M3383_10480, partial [Actinomycetota bacterium]|nr:hypothetical protein [Actinomycetota bacterium]